MRFPLSSLAIGAVSLACVGAAAAAEYAVLDNGFCLRADSHTTDGAVIRLKLRNGVTEFRASRVIAFVPAEPTIHVEIAKNEEEEPTPPSSGGGPTGTGLTNQNNGSTVPNPKEHAPILNTPFSRPRLVATPLATVGVAGMPHMFVPIVLADNRPVLEPATNLTTFVH
jgi:hypothetical protein